MSDRRVLVTTRTGITNIPDRMISKAVVRLGLYFLVQDYRCFDFTVQSTSFYPIETNNLSSFYYPFMLRLFEEDV